MRSLPTEVNNALLAEANFLCHLFEFSLATPVYYTDLDMDVYHGGVWYLSRGISFGGAEYSLSPNVDRLTLEIDNVGLEWSAFVMNQELRGKLAAIKKAALGHDRAVIGASDLFSGIIDAVPEISEQRARIEISSPFVLWRRPVPRANHTSQCRWPFRRPHCEYSGPATRCDQTYERCRELGNELNYGGFRWSHTNVNKQILWGRR